MGEPLDVRQSGSHVAHVLEQLTGSVEGVDDLATAVVAYEPVWAIGTGEVATPELSIHIQYPVSGGVRYRLSSDINGAPAGSSGHADWVKGWEPEVMQTFVARVINPARDGGSHMIGDGRAMTCGYPGCE